MPEARVLRQLVEALLFERLAVWSSELHPPHRGADRELVWSLGAGSYQASGRVGAFGRVRVVEGSVRKLIDGTPRSTSWQEVLQDLPGATPVKAAVAAELENSVRLCRWNAEHLPGLRQARRQLSYEALEAALHEGHPYHPCFKARTGFTLDDHAAYGPEAGKSFELRWLAVRRSSLDQRLPNAEADLWLGTLGAEATTALGGARARAATPSDEYGLLPVHPWQWRHLRQQPGIVAALGRGELVDLKLELGSYRATQSLRTLIPIDTPLGAHLKLPMAVRISSSLRTLEAETVRAAPAISRWLEGVIASDSFFARVAEVTILPEFASAVYTPEAGADELAGHLAAIWREPIGRHLRAGETALPFNALFCMEADGLPFIDPWLTRHGLTAWLEPLLRATLLPLWRLLVHHGVALEAHAQNLILVHRDGLPVRIAMRDFHDSVELVPSFLAEPSRLPNLAAIDPRFAGAPPGRYYAMSSVTELRDMFVDATLVFNLSELSWLLERHYGFSEVAFWRLARGVLDGYGRSRWRSREREAQLDWRAATLPSESLFAARLRAPTDPTPRHTVPNALHDPTERDMHALHQ